MVQVEESVVVELVVRGDRLGNRCRDGGWPGKQGVFGDGSDSYGRLPKTEGRKWHMGVLVRTAAERQSDRDCAGDSKGKAGRKGGVG